MIKLVSFLIIAFLTSMIGCAHSGSTTTENKSEQVDTTAVAAKGDASSLAAKEQHRQKILAMKDITLADLYKRKPEAKEIIEKAEGYAVFDATGLFAVFYIGIAGRGVLIDNANGGITYMTMARAGTGPGLGYEKFRAVIAFKNRKLFDTFKTIGGDIGASGHLVAKGFGMGGGVGGEKSFDPMLSIYQITDKGLAAEVSWGATVFVPDPTLN
ncbi:MAG: hypothetical protein WCJ37_16670 [Syntrophus sp. (in: bacteria)]